MEVLVRDYRSDDAPAIVRVFRDAMNSLRKSRGGMHPDSYVSIVIDRPDGKILHDLLYGSAIVVAEVSETGEVIGMGAISNRMKNRLLGSTYSKNHYVMERYQKRRAGVSVGSILRKATIQKAIELGFRKVYGYATPESAGFHKKFGAKFFPSQNVEKNGVTYQYYEIELRKSIFNSIPIEPYLAELSPLARLLDYIGKKREARSEEFRIGLAKESDMPAIMEVLETANMHHIPSEEMPSLDYSKCFVAKVKGRIVAVGGYKMISPETGKTTVLVVDPQYRGLGIGKALQLKRMEAMEKLGAEKIITNADLPESIEWYKKNFEYRVIGRLKKVHEFGNPVIDHWTTLELDLKEASN